MSLGLFDLRCSKYKKPTRAVSACAIDEMPKRRRLPKGLQQGGYPRDVYGRTNSMTEFWDLDIAAMELEDFEKNGLQVFRNYVKAFDKHAAEQFSIDIGSASFDLTSLDGLLRLVCAEDIRFLPIIVCSFADQQLEQMFKREIPETVPGGRSSMLSGFGSLSRFSQRIQIAYAFGWMGRDLLEELSKLRKIRNDASHSWDLNVLREKVDILIDGRMRPLEKELGDGVRLPDRFWESLNKESTFRVRLVWLVGRCFYESRLFPQAVKRRLNPYQALYGEHKSGLLIDVADKCVSSTKLIISVDSNKSA
ncbi:MAG: hypothetical protein H7X89_05960 [Rhizobiales bacterium]|nr:hypothetical protein [Hyphomicrobiales bacterium]